MSILDSLTTDLDWRESELASLRLLLTKNDITNIQKEVLLRAAWAMLYAHYEGFSKYCLTVFYDEAEKRLVNCKTLPARTKAFALDQHLKTLKNSPSLDMISDMELFFDYIKTTKPSFPEVDTKSNLWPNVLQDLLLDADIIVSELSLHTTKLKTLVSRRNCIAHGQKNFIDEVDYYLTYENAVYEVMYSLVFSIESRLNQAPYSE